MYLYVGQQDVDREIIVTFLEYNIATVHAWYVS